jgi:cobalt/nickel transport system ATP-binding protein
MSAPRLAIDDVRFSYEAAHEVLDGVSLTLMPGERLCITGPNGGGKSTLLQLIVGLITPASGAITILERDCTNEADFVWARRHVGLVFQDCDAQLFCPTVFDDVAFGPLNLGMTKDQAVDVTERTLEELGLSGLRDKVTYRLSYGQKRLVALATVLAMRPEIILLDEPTTGLDARHEDRLAEILLARPEEMIIVTHNRPFLERVATRACRLEGGTLHDIAVFSGVV